MSPLWPLHSRLSPTHTSGFIRDSNRPTNKAKIKQTNTHPVRPPSSENWDTETNRHHHRVKLYLAVYHSLTPGLSGFCHLPNWAHKRLATCDFSFLRASLFPGRPCSRSDHAVSVSAPVLNCSCFSRVPIATRSAQKLEAPTQVAKPISFGGSLPSFAGLLSLLFSRSFLPQINSQPTTTCSL